LARLAGEGTEAMKKQNDGIWLRPVGGEDLFKWECLVLGPALSPYAFGFFTFRIQFPEDYPSNAPHIVIQTTDGGKTRFNPNLYADGKVCLSILGTWRGESGEQWSAVQNAQSVMVSIQSLMDDMPYHNEPGFEKEALSGGKGRRSVTAEALEKVTAKYNLKITHETMRIAVCDVLEETLRADPEKASIFADTVKWHFLLYFNRYMEIIQNNISTTGEFEVMEFEYTRNIMQGAFDFKALEGRLVKIKERLNEEIREWVRLGEVATAKGISSYDCQQVHIALQKFERIDPPGISASPQANNSFVWDVTIIGGLDGGWWENGMYTLKLIFSQEFPDIHPRPRFETKMFHPQISEDGFPFLSVSVAESKNVALLLQDVHSLLKLPPNPDPRTWLNREAAELYFNEGEKGREEYARRVRRCAQRSMED